MKDFAKIVSEQRRQKKMTQEELACILGITPQAVSKWENGVGLPDVTMFPVLADVLDVSIEKLFGVENKKEKIFQVPQQFEGLPIVAEYGNKFCYSGKNLLSAEDGVARFTDGSYADLRSGTVTNCGKGEIRVIRCEQFEEADLSEKESEMFLDFFESISLSISRSCDVRVLTAVDGKARIFAKGNGSFVGAVRHEVKDMTAHIKIGNPIPNRSGNENGNHLTIYVPFKDGKNIDVTINGSSDLSLEPNFVSGNFTVNGSGDIAANLFRILRVQINGSGDADICEVTESAKFRIMGSGDIVVEKAVNPNIKIMGSGDVTAKSVSGNIEIQVNGSGDISCAGEVEKLTVGVAGSGDLNAKGLTVQNAYIKVSGAADLVIGRIKGQSVENLSKGASLKVGQRG